MSQHPIDLLPEAIRLRSQAGLRTGRYITAAVAAVAILVLATTHTRLGLNRARADFAAAREQADLVLSTEAKAAELSTTIADLEGYTRRYDRIALPLEVSAVLATLINRLPDGMTLDRIDLDAGARRVARSPRSKGEKNPELAPPRVLTAEISGFAPDDGAIAEFVAALEQIEPFGGISVDFSRTRAVRGLMAREFRLSFRIELDVPYQIVAASTAAAGDEVQEATHEQ
jgi:hypothetical protein